MVLFDEPITVQHVVMYLKQVVLVEACEPLI
jgi:hypothetical protein